MAEELIQRNPHIEAELLCDIRAERLGRPEEIANAVLWLCSPQVGFVDGHAGGRHILYSSLIPQHFDLTLFIST